MGWWRDDPPPPEKSWQEKAAAYIAVGLIELGRLAVIGLKAGIVASIAHTTKNAADKTTEVAAETVDIVATNAKNVGLKVIKGGLAVAAPKRVEETTSEEKTEDEDKTGTEG